MYVCVVIVMKIYREAPCRPKGCVRPPPAAPAAYGITRQVSST